jgi:hypothetical protein
LAFASASVMYWPCLVLPYQTSEGQWYTLVGVFTHTMPGPPPAAACVVAERGDVVVEFGDGVGVVAAGTGDACGAGIAEPLDVALGAD